MQTNNNLTKNVSQKVLEKFLPGFESNLVICKTIDRSILEGQFDKKSGDTVEVKREHQYRAEETPDGDLTGRDPSPLISATAKAVVGNYITVFVAYSQIEQALKLNNWDKILKPAYSKMASVVEGRAANFIAQNGALSIGTPGIGLSKWEEVSRVSALLTDLGATGKNYAAVSPWSITGLAGAQNSLYNDVLNADSWKKAQIPVAFAGLDAVYRTNSLPARTQGNFGGVLTVKTAPTVNYTSVKDSYQFTVSLSGATASVNGFLKMGDQLIFDGTAWVNQENKEPMIGESGGLISFTATVMADANSDSTGTVTVTLSGVPIYDTTLPQYNTVHKAVSAGDSVLVRGTSNALVKPSLFYNEGFCGMATVELPPLNNCDSSVVNWEGFSIRATNGSDFIKNQQMVRLDLLPAFGCFNPHLGGPLNGGS